MILKTDSRPWKAIECLKEARLRILARRLINVGRTDTQALFAAFVLDHNNTARFEFISITQRYQMSVFNCHQDNPINVKVG